MGTGGNLDGTIESLCNLLNLKETDLSVQLYDLYNLRIGCPVFRMNFFCTLDVLCYVDVLPYCYLPLLVEIPQRSLVT